MKSRLNYSIELLKRAEKLALRLNPENGFYLAFSGGKDSQALYHVAKMAGVRFQAYMSLTSVDPPEVIRFVRKWYPDVELIKPKISIYEMAKKKHILPTRTKRWCCAVYKEAYGAGSVALTGIRKLESARRAKREEVSTQIKGKRGEYTFDEWSVQQETMVTCVNGKDKLIISPIIYWSERDVWDFLNNIVGVPHCELYDQGFRRIGCICCPMSAERQKIKELIRYPHVYRNWLKTIKWLMDLGYVNYHFESPEIGLKWWLSGKPYKEFYADEFMQCKLNF